MDKSSLEVDQFRDGSSRRPLRRIYIFVLVLFHFNISVESYFLFQIDSSFE